MDSLPCFETGKVGGCVLLPFVPNEFLFVHKVAVNGSILISRIINDDGLKDEACGIHLVDPKHDRVAFRRVLGSWTNRDALWRNGAHGSKPP